MVSVLAALSVKSPDEALAPAADTVTVTCWPVASDRLAVTVATAPSARVEGVSVKVTDALASSSRLVTDSEAFPSVR